jgi:tripartite-type tricarboxylate transporter receptor subunit TctC
VKSTAPWQTLEELLAAGKKEPEKYNYGTSGIGGTGQLMMIEVEQVHAPGSRTCPTRAAPIGCRRC